MAAILLVGVFLAILWLLSRDTQRGHDAFAWLQKNSADPFEVSDVLHCDRYKIAVDRMRRRIAFVNVDLQVSQGGDGHATWGGGRAEGVTVVTGYDNVKALRLRRQPPFADPLLDVHFVEAPRPHHVPLLTLIPHKLPVELAFLQRELGLTAEPEAAAQ